ncbi:MAG TPA: ABC transporter permease, partial [Acidimicrobiales bacterium]|nr:ABC transporter permease [Acidimicrobiales bacterium]
MVSVGYAWNELRRRWSRTVVTAVGLAAGVGLVMGIVGVSNGLTQAQNKVLSPLSTVGTDIIVTRTVGATSSTGSTTTTTTAPGGFPGGGGGSGGGGGGGGRGFFAGGAGRGLGGAAGINQLNSSDQAALLDANSSVLTDLSKLGPAGTQFTYDFFVPGTLITFPNQAVSVVSKIPGVSSAVPGLSLQAIHESGTVPNLTDTVTTGGQTVQQTVRPPPLTQAQEEQVQQCLESKGVTFGSGGGATGNSGAGPTATTAPSPGRGGGGGGGGRFGLFGGGAAFQECLPEADQQYIAKVVVPEQTITRVLNPPQTDTQTKTYTVAGVNPTDTSTGLITKAQLVAGKWFGSSPADELLVNTAYASANNVKVGQQLTIDKTTFTVVGLVNPTLTGDTSDIYFDISTLQSLGSNSGRVNEVLVKVSKSSDVSAVAAAIHKELPGAQVLTSKSLANQVTGSLSDAHTLATHLGGALAVIVLLAAFLIAALLTLSSVAKRVREIGTLRAIGWSRGRVIRQIVGETVGIGVLGAVLGVALGIGICAAIGALGPQLTSTSSGAAVGASTVGSIFHQATTAASSTKIKLSAPIGAGTVLLGLVAALVGGLVA